MSCGPGYASESQIVWEIWQRNCKLTTSQKRPTTHKRFAIGHSLAEDNSFTVLALWNRALMILLARVLWTSIWLKILAAVKIPSLRQKKLARPLPEALMPWPWLVCSKTRVKSDWTSQAKTSRSVRKTGKVKKCIKLEFQSTRSMSSKKQWIFFSENSKSRRHRVIEWSSKRRNKVLTPATKKTRTLTNWSRAKTTITSNLTKCANFFT